jgi:hypothetical protein
MDGWDLIDFDEDKKEVEQPEFDRTETEPLFRSDPIPIPPRRATAINSRAVKPLTPRRHVAPTCRRCIRSDDPLHSVCTFHISKLA